MKFSVFGQWLGRRDTNILGEQVFFFFAENVWVTNP